MFSKNQFNMDITINKTECAGMYFKCKAFETFYGSGNIILITGHPPEWSTGDSEDRELKHPETIPESPLQVVHF